MRKKFPGGEKREQYRNQFFKDENPWTGEDEKGFFIAPRTLPLILQLLASKKLSGRLDPTPVYLDLLARHISGGVVEMTDESAHAFASGYFGQRATRTWRERMQLLEKLGFIKTKQIANQRYKLVLLVHPTTAVHRLRNAGKVDDLWWDTYRARQIEIKEDSYEDRQKKRTAKVIPIEAAKAVNK